MYQMSQGYAMSCNSSMSGSSYSHLENIAYSANVPTSSYSRTATSMQNYSVQAKSMLKYNTNQDLATQPSLFYNLTAGLINPYLQSTKGHHLNKAMNSISSNYQNTNVSHKSQIAYDPLISNQIKIEYSFQPDLFLQPNKTTKFVGKAEEVKEFVEDTFSKIFDQPLPNDIKISILDEKDFFKITNNSSAVGLSINRSEQGLLSEIFVLNGTLGKVLLTLGHELGHVLSPTLSNPQMEEAKAYAFSFLWMDVIKEHNIANLQNVLVTEMPAHNGLHDVAFDFVMQQKATGKDDKEIYGELIAA